MKQIVLMFPDYCSTGLWYPGGYNLDPTELGVSSGLQLALKYWHEVWEFTIADSGGIYKPTASENYIARWIEDGKILAALLTAENDKYEFEYKA